MVAMICQLYPNASPSNLLRKFFTIYTKWTWPNPVLLTKPFDAKIQGPDYHYLQVWTNPLGNREQMPIITPAYPCMNSSLAVNRKTLQVMHNELVKAHEVVENVRTSALKFLVSGGAILTPNSPPPLPCPPPRSLPREARRRTMGARGLPCLSPLTSSSATSTTSH